MVKAFDDAGGSPGATLRAAENSRQARVKALARCAASRRALFLICRLFSTVTTLSLVKGPGSGRRPAWSIGCWCVPMCHAPWSDGHQSPKWLPAGHRRGDRAYLSKATQPQARRGFVGRSRQLTCRYEWRHTLVRTPSNVAEASICLDLNASAGQIGADGHDYSASIFQHTKQKRGR